MGNGAKECLASIFMRFSKKITFDGCCLLGDIRRAF